ncbi:FAD dependent oxidoreductase [Penicillium riverlandense]|uniref:FAD dependent oxidoreductase n=1 Tax=Penicillium riverlandense TaxID=1903569 RepID=UPI0025493074|nr:FAD dependent oxidoreductase [Penicillium riverlandense]KAJ5815342.1 FAD dependent oxidoreductase [Penicillium riverlandense]
MADLEIPPELLVKLAGQVVQNPGIPVDGPTVSAWQEPSHPLANVQSKTLPECVDYAIIGSGITGCSVAKTILESEASRDKKVAVFEARSLATGATSRNGGYLMSHAPTNFKRFADTFGAQAAKEIALFCNRNLKQVYDLTVAEGLEKESHLRGVTVVTTFEEKELFDEACEAIRMYEEAIPEKRGQHKIVDKETAKKEFNLKKTFGAITLESHMFWPYRLVTNLWQRLLERYAGRFSVETQTPVTSVTLSKDAKDQYPYVLATPRGTVRAAKVFHCVSGFTGYLLPKLRGPLFPCRLTMSTQKPGPQYGNRPYAWLFHVNQSYDPTTTVTAQGLFWMQQNAQSGDLFVGGDIQRLDDFLSSDDSVISADSAANLIKLLPNRIFDKGWTNPITNSELPSATALHRIWSGILSMTPDQAIARMALGEAKPEWLPDVYLSTEKRLTDQAMGPEAALHSFFAR